MKRRKKLNMLEPGMIICKINAVLLMAALLFYVSGYRIAGFILGGAASALFLILLILVKIELYQDKQDYLKWKNNKNKD